jgi:hypothetical protein
MLSFVDRRRACPHPQWLRRCEGRRHLTAYFLYSGSPSTGAFGMSPYRQLATLETPFLRQLVSPSIRPPPLGYQARAAAHPPTPRHRGRLGGRARAGGVWPDSPPPPMSDRVYRWQAGPSPHSGAGQQACDRQRQTPGETDGGHPRSANSPPPRYLYTP